ncbi:HAMP domain-containing sensor histidine kinase [Myxococcaceae bacterium GXIMD 01537]
MKLRLRLALTAVALTLPVICGLAVFRESMRRRTTEETLQEFTRAQMLSGGRERCEAAPTSWMTARPGEPPPFEPRDRPPPPPPPRDEPGGWRRKPPPRGPPPRIQLFAYDSQLTASDPRAPVLDEELREAAREGQETFARRTSTSGEPVLEMLLRMPWEGGPCAFILARRPESPDVALRALPPLDEWGPPTLAILVAMLVALGPVVRRIHKLTQEVRASADSRYQWPVSVRGSDEVAELARAFQDARQEIQRQTAKQEAREQALREFLANTTHDVMTPLTVLQGHLASLQGVAARGAPLEPAQVASAMSEVNYMASLVHNLAAAARLEAGEPEVQRAPVDLNALVARVVARHLPIARQSRVSLESGVPEAPLWVMGDVTLLEQALSNVVFNGLRYGREDGHVAVVLEGPRQGRFELRVLDDGPGIPEEERSRLMERRVRGNAARTRAPQGQGLGLSIAQRVAELHGWTLALKPSEYGGLEASFTGAVHPGPPAPGDVRVS